MNKLPIFDIVLNDEDIKQGVGMISLVDEPAIGVNWIKLANQDQMHFKVDKEKQMLYGPFLIPNMLIYRSDEKNGEYYVRFSRTEIEKIATKFNEDLNNRNINFMHTEETVEAFVAQNWLIESDRDKSGGLGFDLPEGTWFGGVKIKDLAFWQDKVKTDKVKGFSVEILADLELSLKNKYKQMKELGKKKRKFIAKQKFDEAVETEAGELIVIAEEIAVGQEVVVVMDDLVAVDSYDGVVVIDEQTVTMEQGVITEVVEAGEEPAAEEPAAEETELNEVDGYVSPEQVSQMIDVRFAEIMEEITRMKAAMEGNTEELKKTINKSIDEKFKTTPATDTIKKSNVDAKFKTVEDRVKAFARIK